MLANERHWSRPNCDQTAVTHHGETNRFHPCRGMKGLTAPMVPAGIRCKVEAVQREDYIAGDLVQTDGEGRPVMAAVVTRDDGTDVAVYAPTAIAGRG
jgi:hypothetical protein